MINLNQVVRTAMIAGVLERTASAPAVLRRYPDITRAEIELVRQRMIEAARRARGTAWFPAVAAMVMNQALPGLGTAARFLYRRNQ